MDIKFINFQNHSDERGSLVVLEEGKEIPFPVERIYYLFNTGKGIERGAHAHTRISQIAIPIKGTCTILIDNGKEKQELLLNDPTKGLVLESFIWRDIYDFSEDCVLLLLASEHYDENEYIRDYQEFLTMVGQSSKE